MHKGNRRRESPLQKKKEKNNYKKRNGSHTDITEDGTDISISSSQVLTVSPVVRPHHNRLSQ